MVAQDTAVSMEVVTMSIKSARQANLLRALATDILDDFVCQCNENERPQDCDCGGDGQALDGCWACQAYTALHGFGTPPKEPPR